MTDDAGPEDLEQVAEIARELADAASVDDLLQRIADLGERYVEDCDGVSIMFVHRGGRITSPAFSSRVAYDSDQAQYVADEGPCLEAIREHHTIVIDDLEDDERWPVYRRLALELGVRSMISFRLFVREDTMGALDFYSRTPHVFGARSRLIGQVFASHAAVALKAAITEAGLTTALASRDVIGQAKGVLMEREHLTAPEAFARLTTISQAINRPLRDIAAEIAETGDVPSW
jgi:GAF domain-containing protein